MSMNSGTYDLLINFGFNRYAYCAYNPLKYVDPSGYRYYGYDEGAYYRMIDEMTRTIQREWHLVYESAMESAQLTISLACGLYSHGLDTHGNGSGNHGSPGGGGIQVKDLGNNRYEVVGGCVGPDHSITVIDGDNAGTVIGYYLTDYSFADKDGNIMIGATIDLNDYSGQEFWDKYTNNPPYLGDYITDIYLGDKTNMLFYGNYNFKYLGYTDGNKETYAYRGMPIYFGDGINYITTARDIGNAYAGFIAEYKGLTYDITRRAFDSYNGSPEPPVSRYAQDYGYYLGKNYITPRWREKLYNIYRP